MTSIRMIALGLLAAILMSASAAASASGASFGVMGWGNNKWGQLGNGTTIGSDVPVTTTGLSEVNAVAAGWEHSLALLDNGTVMAWGGNGSGELGNGTTSPSLAPVAVPGLGSVTAISAGSNYSLALLSNGKVMAWGENGFGQLGTGTTTNSEIPVAVPGLSEVTAIAAGMRISMALLRNGTVMAWGYNGPATQGGELGIGTPIGPDTCGGVYCSLRPIAVVGLSEATAIAAGHSHNLALLKNGTVMAWGGNSYGQLGVGRERLPSGKDRSYVPVQARGLTEATAVSAGSKYSMALLRNGTMMAWGKNVYGELGLGDEADRRVPTPVPGLSGVVAISAGGGAEHGAGHSLALLSDGTVMGWGSNSEGELGSGNTINTPVPVPVSGLTGATGISSGSFHSLALGSPVTLPTPPDVTAEAPSSLTQTSATLNATVNPNGATVSDCHFDYGTSASYGSRVPCASPPGSGTSPVMVSARLEGLSASTSYHFRILATNPGGTSAGTDQTFTTPANPPGVLAGAPSSLTQTSATLNATVNPNGATVSDCHFDYGTSASYGSSAPCGPLPGSGTAPVEVSAQVGGLNANTAYHFRILATNPGGTSSGADQTFTTTPTGSPAGQEGPSGGQTTLPGTQGTLRAQGVLPFTQSAAPLVPDAELASTSLAVSPSGTFVLTVTCPAAVNRCVGTLTLRTLAAVVANAAFNPHAHSRKVKASVLTLATGSFTVAGGRASRVKLRLSARARALLARVHVTRARVTILARDPTGATHTTQTTVTLRAPKPAHRHGHG